MAKSDFDMFEICTTMKDLEYQVQRATDASEAWILPGCTTSPLEQSEEVVCRALRCMARIKLNR
jgi:hypothetical protein